ESRKPLTNHARQSVAEKFTHTSTDSQLGQISVKRGSSRIAIMLMLPQGPAPNASTGFLAPPSPPGLVGPDPSGQRLQQIVVKGLTGVRLTHVEPKRMLGLEHPVAGCCGATAAPSSRRRASAPGDWRFQIAATRLPCRRLHS